MTLKTILQNIKKSFYHLAMFILGPLKTGAIFGRIPYRPVTISPFVKSTFPPPLPFDCQAPIGFPAGSKWNQPKITMETLNYMVYVPHGFADNKGFVFDRRFNPIYEACHPHRMTTKYRERLRLKGIETPYLRPPYEPIRFTGQVGIVTASNQDMYAHWLLDILPRIAKLLEMVPDISLIFAKKKFNFQRETLSVLGLQNKTLCASQTPLITADELVVPCHQIAWRHHHPQWVCSWLRDTFLAPLTSRKPGDKRVFISRSLAQTRHLENENEISSFLSTLGFKCFHPETLSFQDQVLLYQGAEVIVATHGSGMANLVFCDPGTKVLELFPSRTVDSFYRLATDMNLQYRFVKTRLNPPKSRVSENFTIELEDLQKGLSALNVS